MYDCFLILVLISGYLLITNIIGYDLVRRWEMEAFYRFNILCRRISLLLSVVIAIIAYNFTGIASISLLTFFICYGITLTNINFMEKDSNRGYDDEL